MRYTGWIWGAAAAYWIKSLIDRWQGGEGAVFFSLFRPLADSYTGLVSDAVRKRRVTRKETEIKQNFPERS